VLATPGQPKRDESPPSQERKHRKLKRQLFPRLVAGGCMHIFYRIRRWVPAGNSGYRSIRWALLRQSAPGAVPWVDWISERDRSTPFDLEEALITIEEYELQGAVIYAQVLEGDCHDA
jgi:hypothetical protein